jgi:signal transduction protein with GAF and PtsI domain
MNEIEYLEKRIDEQTQQLEEMKKRLATDFETKEAFDVYASFLRAGFDKDQAWELFMTIFQAAVR